MNRFVLRRDGFEAFQGWNLWFQCLFFLSLVCSIVYIFSITRDVKLFFEPFVIGTVALVIYCYLYGLFIRRSKLEINEFGLSHESEVPIFLKRFFPDWQISWSEIQKVEEEENTISKFTVLKPLNFKLINRNIKILPSNWVDPNEESKSNWWFRYKGVPPKFEEDILVRILKEKGYLDAKPSNLIDHNKSTGSDLNSDPVSIGMVVFLFFSIFYFIAEVYFTLSEFYASSPPYIYMVIGAFITVILSYLLLLKTKFIPVEKIVLALMMGCSMATVMYPLMLRVNEWTDTEGLKSYSYVKSGLVNWNSNNNNFQVPSLKFDLESSKFWAKFEKGDIKEFELRRGGLGFYQIYMESIYEEQRIFYGGKRAMYGKR